MGLQMPLLATQYFAMAVGSTRLVFIREFLFFLVRTPIFIWAAVEYGLIGAAYAVAACGFVHIALNLALYAKVSGDAMFRPVLRAHRSLVAAGLMAAAILGARAAGLTDGFVPLLRVCADVILGAGVYVVVHALLWRIEGSPDGVERLILGVFAPIVRKFARRNA
jgi:PST family polysaccharide transporter